MWFVYVLECSDGSYYTGMTSNLKERMNRHSERRGSFHTSLRLPVRLKYYEEFKDRAEAERREIEIKKLSIKNKNRLIQWGNGKRFPSPLNAG